MNEAAETGSLDMGGASDAFESLYGGDHPVEETQEDAAARLVAEEAAGKETQDEAQDDVEQEGETVAEPDTVTIEVDGKPVQMSKAELAEAVKGQMRQADYTQKTMAVADRAKEVAAAKEAATKERNELAQKLQTYTIQTEGNLGQIEAQLTDDLWKSDPVEYLALERTLRKGQADIAKAKQDMQNLYEQHQAEQQEASKNFIKQQHETLIAKLPEWKDPEKMKAGMSQLESFLTESGYKAEDGMTVLDARLLLIASDAMKYRDLMARAGVATQKVAAAPPKVERSGVAAQRNGAVETQKAALNKLTKGGGKLSDAAKAFEAFM